MEEKVRPELQCMNMDAAAQLMQLAIDDAAMVEQTLAQLASRLVDTCRNGVSQATQADADTVDLRAQHVLRIAAVMVEGAHALADIGGTTRARFSRLLTERLASGSNESIDAYQAFFNVLPSQNSNAIDSMQVALSRCDEALDDALGFAMQPACADPAELPARHPPTVGHSAAASP